MVLPPSTQFPYDNLSTVLQVARTRLNDAIVTIAGDTFTDTQPFTQVMSNSAWRRLQEFLSNIGYSRFTKRVILERLPIVANQNPAVETRINWISYNDGNSEYDAPVLPPDLIQPLKLAERISGQNAGFWPMMYCADGLPSHAPQGRNAIWEWREDCIVMPGSQNLMDLEIRYAAYLPDFSDSPDGKILWVDQPVPIMRSQDALACFICAEMAMSRGDLDGSSFLTQGQNAARLINNRDVVIKQRVNLQRLPRSGRWGSQDCY